MAYVVISHFLHFLLNTYWILNIRYMKGNKNRVLALMMLGVLWGRQTSKLYYGVRERIGY